MDSLLGVPLIVPYKAGEYKKPAAQKPPSTQKERAAKPELSLQDLSNKVLLTLEEANRYTGLGLQKLRDITNAPDSKIVLWNGGKRMLKRKRLEDYLENQYSI